MSGIDGSDSFYEYNCPQFVDFTAPVPADDDALAEAYFEFDHENAVTVDLDREESAFQSPTTDAHQQWLPASKLDYKTEKPKTRQCQSSSEPIPMDSEIAGLMVTKELNKRPLVQFVKALPEYSKNLYASEAPEESETQPETQPETHDTEERKPGVLSNIVTSLEAWRSKSSTALATKPGASCSDKAKLGMANTTRPIRTGIRSPRSRTPRTTNASPGSNGKVKQPRGPTDSPARKKQRQVLGNASQSANCKPLSTLKRERSNTISTPRHGASKHDLTSDCTRRPRSRTLSKPSTPGPMTRSRTLSQKPLPLASVSATAAMDTLKAKRQSPSVERPRDAKKPTSLGACTKAKLTMPKTPSFMKRTQKTAQFKSTEELEMERIKHFKKELAKRRKLAAESHRTVQMSAKFEPVKSLHPLTRPTEFHFATDERLKNTDKEDEKGGKSFVSGLRDHSHSPERAAHRGPTKPQPFRFAGRKRKHRDAQGKDEQERAFHSMAEKVIAFSSRTPERFHSKRVGSKESPAKTAWNQAQPPRLTIPKTPNFETRSRHRPVTVKSQSQREEEEVEEMKKYKFQAKPVNDQIFTHSNLGIRKIPKKELTEPEGFELESDRRVQQRQEQKRAQKQEEHYEFHANPVPKEILEKAVGVKPIRALPLTVPESPAFALKNRVRSHLKDIEPQIPEEAKRVLRSRPVQHTGIPYQPKVVHKTTEVEPFSFDKRDREMLSKKEEKLQKMQEETQHQPFRANPIPPTTPDALPAVPHRSPTQPEPFELECDIRGEQKAQEWSSKIEEELRSLRAQAQFKAKPCSVVLQEPFHPAKSTKPLTDVSDFELNTERRAEKREEWETWKKEREVQELSQQAAEERQRQEEEKKEIARLRQELVHKPNPIRHYRAVQVHSSTKPLTEPHTPRFSERLRAKTVRY